MAKKAKRKPRPKAQKPPTRPAFLSATATADLCGFTPHWLRQLERQGWFAKVGRNQYDPIEVLKGQVRFLQDDSRRSSKSATASALQEARSREIEQRIAREDGKLIPIEDVHAVVTDILGTFRAELSGVAAAATRDLAVRDTIEGQLNGAIDRCRQRFEQAGADLQAGREVLVDGEETTA
jgi:hypothetical protein